VTLPSQSEWRTDTVTRQNSLKLIRRSHYVPVKRAGARAYPPAYRDEV